MSTATDVGRRRQPPSTSGPPTSVPPTILPVHTGSPGHSVPPRLPGRPPASARSPTPLSPIQQQQLQGTIKGVIASNINVGPTRAQQQHTSPQARPPSRSASPHSVFAGVSDAAVASRTHPAQQQLQQQQQQQHQNQQNGVPPLLRHRRLSTDGGSSYTVRSQLPVTPPSQPRSSDKMDLLAAASFMLVPMSYMEDPVTFRRERKRANIDRRLAEAVWKSGKKAKNMPPPPKSGSGKNGSKSGNLSDDMDCSGHSSSVVVSGNKSGGKKSVMVSPDGSKRTVDAGGKGGEAGLALNYCDDSNDHRNSNNKDKTNTDVYLLPPSYLLRWIQWAEHTGAYGLIRRRHQHIMQQYERKKEDVERQAAAEREAQAKEKEKENYHWRSVNGAKSDSGTSVDEALLTGLVDGLCIDWNSSPDDPGPGHNTGAIPTTTATSSYGTPVSRRNTSDTPGTTRQTQQACAFHYDPAPDIRSLHNAHVQAYRIKNALDCARFYHGLPSSQSPPIPPPKPLASQSSGGAVTLGRTASLPSPAASRTDASARLVQVGAVGGPTPTSPRSSANDYSPASVIGVSNSGTATKPPMLPLFATVAGVKDEPVPPGPIDASSLLEVGVMGHMPRSPSEGCGGAAGGGSGDSGKRRPPRTKSTSAVPHSVSPVGKNTTTTPLTRRNKGAVPILLSRIRSDSYGDTREVLNPTSHHAPTSPIASSPQPAVAPMTLPLLLRRNLFLTSDLAHHRVMDTEDEYSQSSKTESLPPVPGSVSQKKAASTVVAAPTVSSLAHMGRIDDREDEEYLDLAVDWPLHRDRGVCAVPAEFYNLVRSTQGVLCTDGVSVSFQDLQDTNNGMEVYCVESGGVIGTTQVGGGEQTSPVKSASFSEGNTSGSPRTIAPLISPKQRRRRRRRTTGHPSPTSPNSATGSTSFTRGRPIEFRRRVTLLPDNRELLDIYPLKIKFEVLEPEQSTLPPLTPPASSSQKSLMTVNEPFRPNSPLPSSSNRRRGGFVLVPTGTKVQDSIAFLTRHVAPGKSSEQVRIWYRSDVRRLDGVVRTTAIGDGWELMQGDEMFVDDLGKWKAPKEQYELLVEIRSSPTAPWMREALELKNRIQVGDFIDAQDSLGIWCEAVVREATERTIKVHYFGWSSRWDSLLRRDHQPCFHPAVLSRAEPPAPLWSHSRNWRENILPGTEVEVREVNSTVQRPRWFKGVVRVVGRPQDQVREIVCGAPLETFEEDEKGGLHRTLLLNRTQQVLVEVPQEKAKVSVHSVSPDEHLVPQQSFRRWVNLYGEEICEAYTHNKRKAPSVAPATVSYVHPPDRQRVEIMRSKTNGYGEGYVRESLRGIPPAPGSVGLHNLGNTCYMNSILQCMNHIAPLTQYFRNGLYHKDLNKQNPLGSGGRVALSYANLLSDIWGGEYTAIAPRQIKQTISQFAPQFANLLQHDSQEFCSFLMDGIHEDLNRVKIKPYVEDVEARGQLDDSVACETWRKHLLRHDSVIVDKCQGMHRSHLVCPQCGHESVKFDVYSTISLPASVAEGDDQDASIPLSACLDQFTSPEELDKKNAWYCPKCKEHVLARKHITLWTTPDILILHVKRFTYNAVGTRGRLRRSKLDNLIKFPIEGLDLTKYVMGPKSNNGPPIYTLFGVSEHSGSTATSGHYTATVRNSADGKWYWYNDSHVGNSTGEASINGGAYVLFYSRTKGQLRWAGLEEFMRRKGIDPKSNILDEPKVDDEGFTEVVSSKRKKNRIKGQ